MGAADERPDGGGWVAAAAAVAGFLAGGGLCLAGCYGLLHLYAMGLPRRAEVSDSLAEVPAIVCGSGFALALSLGAGTAAAGWAARRARRKVTAAEKSQ